MAVGQKLGDSARAIGLGEDAVADEIGAGGSAGRGELGLDGLVVAGGVVGVGEEIERHAAGGFGDTDRRKRGTIDKRTYVPLWRPHPFAIRTPNVLRTLLPAKLLSRYSRWRKSES